MRTASLLPSATETLCLLGASETLVGRSHECDFPPSIADRPVLTAQRTEFTSSADVDERVTRSLAAGESLYTLDAERLQQLRPDLILTQDLCDVCSIDLETVRGVAAQMDPPPRVLSLNPLGLEDVFDDITRVAEEIGRVRAGQDALVSLRERLHRAQDHVPAFAEPVRTVFLEWTDPLFIGGHWTPQLIERAGGSHPLNPTEPIEDAGAGSGMQGALRLAGKSIRVPSDAVAAVGPEAIIICPCGLTLEQMRAEAEALRAHAWFNELPAVREKRVALVDGNQMFNRPGPRLVDAFEWLVSWLNGLPHLMPADFPWEPLDA